MRAEKGMSSRPDRLSFGGLIERKTILSPYPMPASLLLINNPCGRQQRKASNNPMERKLAQWGPKGAASMVSSVPRAKPPARGRVREPLPLITTINNAFRVNGRPR